MYLLFKNFACCDTHYATLDKASAIVFAYDVRVVFLQGQTPLTPVDEGEGVVISEDKHWLHGGTQIHIKMFQCQNERKALLFNSGVHSLVLVKLGEVQNCMRDLPTVPLLEELSLFWGFQKLKIGNFSDYTFHCNLEQQKMMQILLEILLQHSDCPIIVEPCFFFLVCKHFFNTKKLYAYLYDLIVWSDAPCCNAFWKES